MSLRLLSLAALLGLLGCPQGPGVPNPVPAADAGREEVPACPLPGQIPAEEVCNGLDDDCDGEVDEGGVCDDPCDEAW